MSESLSTDGLYRRGSRRVGSEHRWLWWPIKLRWYMSGWTNWFMRHGFEERAAWVVEERDIATMSETGHTVKWFAQTWHLGPLKIILGNRRK